MRLGKIIVVCLSLVIIKYYVKILKNKFVNCVYSLNKFVYSESAIINAFRTVYLYLYVFILDIEETSVFFFKLRQNVIERVSMRCNVSITVQMF